MLASAETLLRTGVATLALPLALAFASLGVILVMLRGRSARDAHPFYVGFARRCLWMGRTRLEVHGRERIQPGQAYVVVPNHESAWDPPCVVAALPELVLRFVVKRELMRIPIFGHALHRSGNVTVVRSETSGDVERIREGMEHRDPAVSLLFFAEGTRTRDGALQPFKMGAFASALEYGLPILPVAIAGTREVCPRGTLMLRRGPVVIEVGEPIPTDQLKLEDRASLRSRTHEVVAQLRARARDRLRVLGGDRGEPAP